jgi:predicted LPLAT superfamily acyltransferase
MTPPDGHGLTTSAPRWSGRTRGGYLGNWFFVQLIRLLGVRWARAWLVLVAAYFTLAAPRSYRCSVEYLKRVLGPQPCWRWPGLVYCHFFSYGLTLLDRLAVITGRSRMECTCEGEELLRQQADLGKGLILLGAHLGNWEIGGHLLERLERPVNLVVLDRERERLRRLFRLAMEARRFRLLTADDHPLRSVPILAALRRGEIVALHGDRSFGGADLSIPFLGGTASFPVGPYLLAAVSGSPIAQVFVVRERIGRYRLFCFPARFLPRELGRANPEALRPHVSEYAQRVANVARQYPFQWYNFYPFWEGAAARAAPRSLPTGPHPDPP